MRENSFGEKDLLLKNLIIIKHESHQNEYLSTKVVSILTICHTTTLHHYERIDQIKHEKVIKLL